MHVLAIFRLGSYQRGHRGTGCTRVLLAVAERQREAKQKSDGEKLDSYIRYSNAIFFNIIKEDSASS